MPPSLLVLSRTDAEAYDPSGVEVCISISNPQTDPVPLSEKFQDIIRLVFTDIAGPSPLPFDRLFSPDHAEAVVEFVSRWRHCDRIVVHCVAGQSRSPAVAMGICEVFGWAIGTLEQDHPLWNTYVRLELVRVGRELTSR
jgi:predicted protein tyrosine phosphatase